MSTGYPAYYLPYYGPEVAAGGDPAAPAQGTGGPLLLGSALLPSPRTLPSSGGQTAPPPPNPGTGVVLPPIVVRPPIAEAGEPDPYVPTVGAGILEGAGPALREQAGPLLPGLCEALALPINDVQELVDSDWRRAFDLDLTPYPAWLGQLAGARVPGGLTRGQQRTYVRERRGSLRGTVGALVAAVKSTLIGGQRVEVVERIGSPYRVLVRTYAGETQDSAKTLAAALSQKPVGLILMHEITGGATYQHMSDVHGPTYADFTRAFATYGDATTHLPEEGAVVNTGGKYTATYSNTY